MHLKLSTIYAFLKKNIQNNLLTKINKDYFLCLQIILCIKIYLLKIPFFFSLLTFIINHLCMCSLLIHLCIVVFVHN